MLLLVIFGVLWVCVMLMVVMWFGLVFEDCLLCVSMFDVNLKVVLLWVGCVLFVFVVILIGLLFVGIDVMVFGVFGGVVGVGFGFGL